MSDPVIFSVNGDAVAWMRSGVTVRGRYATLYTPTTLRTYEKALGVLAKVAMKGRKPFAGSVSASFRFRLGLPKSMSKRERAAILSGEQAYWGNKDCDNLAKASLDGMNKIVYNDDVQVVRLFVEKIGSAKAGIDIKIQPLGPE